MKFNTHIENSNHSKKCLTNKKNNLYRICVDKYTNYYNLNGFTGISCCYNINLQSSSLSKNFKKFRFFEKYNEVGNTSIAKFNALFHILPFNITKITPLTRTPPPPKNIILPKLQHFSNSYSVIKL